MPECLLDVANNTAVCSAGLVQFMHHSKFAAEVSKLFLTFSLTLEVDAFLIDSPRPRPQQYQGSVALRSSIPGVC